MNSESLLPNWEYQCFLTHQSGINDKWICCRILTPSAITRKIDVSKFIYANVVEMYHLKYGFQLIVKDPLIEILKIDKYLYIITTLHWVKEKYEWFKATTVLLFYKYINYIFRKEKKTCMCIPFYYLKISFKITLWE